MRNEGRPSPCDSRLFIATTTLGPFVHILARSSLLEYFESGNPPRASHHNPLHPIPPTSTIPNRVSRSPRPLHRHGQSPDKIFSPSFTLHYPCYSLNDVVDLQLAQTQSPSSRTQLNPIPPKTMNIIHSSAPHQTKTAS
jgi:hypothetical protein